MIDTKTKVSDEDIKAVLDRQLNQQSKGVWIILYMGHQVVVDSGKSSWPTIHAAKAALKCHLQAYIWILSGRVAELSRYDKYINKEIWERIKCLVEFKQLR